MSRDHRPPIRNPFLPPTSEEPEVTARDRAPGPLPSARVLVVCTGYICRSAYVEHALQAQLNALLGDRARRGPAAVPPDADLLDPAQPSGAKIASTTCCAHSSSGTSTRS